MAQSEASLDRQYITKTPGVTRNTMKATICPTKLKCDQQHPLKWIRPLCDTDARPTAYQCNSCDHNIAIVKDNHRNQGNYLIGCVKCDYHLCRNCYTSEQYWYRYQ